MHAKSYISGRPVNAAEIAKNTLAGAMAVWVMDRATWWLWNRQNPQSLAQEQRARPGGLDPAHVIANRVANLFGRKMTPAQPHPVGIATHYLLGIAPAILYGLYRKRSNRPSTGKGLLFGLGVFLLEDQLINTQAKFANKPGAYPWQSHARGVAGHLIYGAATHASLKLLDRWLKR